MLHNSEIYTNIFDGDKVSLEEALKQLTILCQL